MRTDRGPNTKMETPAKSALTSALMKWQATMAAGAGEQDTDDGDDEGFRKENFEYVEAPRADRAENADFLFLIGNGYGNKITEQQCGERRYNEPRIEKYFIQSIHHSRSDFEQRLQARNRGWIPLSSACHFPVFAARKSV